MFLSCFDVAFIIFSFFSLFLSHLLILSFLPLYGSVYMYACSSSMNSRMNRFVFFGYGTFFFIPKYRSKNFIFSSLRMQYFKSMLRFHVALHFPLFWEYFFCFLLFFRMIRFLFLYIVTAFYIHITLVWLIDYLFSFSTRNFF